LDTSPIPAQPLEKFYHIDGIQPERHYREHLSDFKNWQAADHAEEWLIFPQNTGTHLSMDETSLSSGEPYTVITGKAAKGRKGALAAIMERTASDTIIDIIEKIPQKQREQVKEVTPDMAESMRKTVRRCVPDAIRVTDRFHVQKSACDALQEMRIAHRRDAINQDTGAREQARFSNLPTNGQPDKNMEHSFSFNFIPISGKSTRLPTPCE